MSPIAAAGTAEFCLTAGASSVGASSVFPADSADGVSPVAAADAAEFRFVAGASSVRASSVFPASADGASPVVAADAELCFVAGASSVRASSVSLLADASSLSADPEREIVERALEIEKQDANFFDIEEASPWEEPVESGEEFWVEPGEGEGVEAEQGLADSIVVHPHSECANSDSDVSVPDPLLEPP